MKPTLLLATLFGLSALARATEVPYAWGETANEAMKVVRSGHYTNWAGGLTINAAGESIVVWSDARQGNLDLYAQKISADGQSLLWGDEEAPFVINAAPDEQSKGIVIDDGVGGAFVAWLDFRGGVPGGSLYMQRIGDAPGGGAQWHWPQEVLIHSGNHAEFDQSQRGQPLESGSLCGAPDGQGGCWLAWTDWRNGNLDPFVCRITAGGQILQGFEGGLVVPSTSEDDRELQLAVDGNGGVWLAWQSGYSEVRLQHLDEDGQALGPPEGILAGDPGHHNQDPVLVVNNSEATLGWIEAGNGDYTVYAQRYTGDLVSLWPGIGVPASNTTPSYLSLHDVILQDDGSCLLLWSGNFSSGTSLIMQQVNSEGQVVLEPEGRLVHSGPLYTKHSKLTAMGDHFVFNWAERDPDLAYLSYVRKLDATLEPVWEEDVVFIEHSGLVEFVSTDSGLRVVHLPRNGPYALSHQLIAGDGTLLLNEEQQHLSGSPFSGIFQLSILGRSFGLQAFWQEDGDPGLTYQRIDGSSGQPLFPEEGVRLFPNRSINANRHIPGPGEDFYSAILTDSRIRLQRHAADGTAVWPEDYSATEEDVNLHDGLHLCTHEDNLIVAWYGSLGNDSYRLDLFAQAFNASGQPLWGSNGTIPTQELPLEAWPTLRSMNRLGPNQIVLVYKKGNWENPILHALRLHAETGETLGQIELSPEGQLRSPQTVELASGNVAIVGHTAEGNLRAMALTVDGEIAWDLQTEPQGIRWNDIALQEDGHGGLFLLYSEWHSESWRLLHILADGTLRWQDEPILDLPASVSSSNLSAMGLWDSPVGHTLSLAIINNVSYPHHYLFHLQGAGISSSDPMEIPELWRGTVIRDRDWHGIQSLHSTHSQDHGMYLAWIERIPYRHSRMGSMSRLVVTRLGEISTAVDDPATRPATLALRAKPNPFNPRTQLDFQLLRPSTVSLKVYDIQGRLVREVLDGVALGAGTHHAVLQAAGPEGELASGVYLVQLKTEHGEVVRKVTLLR